MSFLFPYILGDILIPLAEDLPAEKKQGIDKPEEEENAAGYTRVLQGNARKRKQEQQRGYHNHGRKV